MSPKDRTIGSWADLRRNVASIVEELNADRALGLAAAANPLFALEELGYEIDPDARPGIEDRLRFGPEVAKRVATCRAEVFELAGERFDMIDDAEVRRVLDQLGVRPAKRRGSLEKLRDEHPIMPSLIAYRELDAGEPRLAGRDIYTSVRRGRVRLPVTRVRAVLKQDGGD